MMAHLWKKFVLIKSSQTMSETTKATPSQKTFYLSASLFISNISGSKINDPSHNGFTVLQYHPRTRIKVDTHWECSLK